MAQLCARVNERKKSGNEVDKLSRRLVESSVTFFQRARERARTVTADKAKLEIAGETPPR